MPNAILDPTGRTRTRPAAANRLALAPRPRRLAGLRVGLLDNTKHNAALLLDEVAALLVAEHGAAGVTRRQTKAVFSLPVPEDVIADYRQDCDVVLTGVGDCGSCSAASTADGVAFERAGLPAAVICTNAFIRTADAMAEMRGAPGYQYAVTEHPVAVLTPEQIRARAKQVVDDVVALLTTPADGS